MTHLQLFHKYVSCHLYPLPEDASCRADKAKVKMDLYVFVIFAGGAAIGGV